MTISARIYASGALAFGGQPAIDDLLSAGYSAVIVWSVHVASDGTLTLNDTQIVSKGVYHEAQPMDLPERLAQLRRAGVQIIFSVGAGGVSDYQHIGALLKKGTGPTSPLYENFKALKDAMAKAQGGGIDAIDFDNEDDMQTSIMVGFGNLLASIGYPSVTFCPYYTSPVWNETYTELLKAHHKGFVSAIHLQCYSGGQGASPKPWGEMIAKHEGKTLLVPGLATNQAASGPWWSGGAQGGSVVKSPGVAMYGGADWSGRLVRRGNYPSAQAAMQSANSGENFFFYCNDFMSLGPDKVFQAGDAAFFSGIPQWGSAPQADGYALSGGCSNIYNRGGACPSDLQTQYATWAKEPHPPTGGFIWLYDSVVSCLLSGCCGGKENVPVTTALAYRQAITNGLG
ncbi:MAG: hypothetical protein WA840_10750 [Caulobacteraceae bacterium]